MFGYSPEKGYNLPFSGNLVAPKLVLIPGFRPAGCRTKVHHDKNQAQQDRQVEVPIRGCRDDTHAQIQQAFAGIVRADDVSEPSLAWQGVFLEARQVCVALILLKPAEAEERHAEGKCEWGVSFELLDLPGMEDNSCRHTLDS